MCDYVLFFFLYLKIFLGNPVSDSSLQLTLYYLQENFQLGLVINIANYETEKCDAHFKVM